MPRRRNGLSVAAADDLAAFDDHVDVEQRAFVGERIASQDHDVGELAGLERAQVGAAADRDRGVTRHDRDQVLVREHEVQRPELVLDTNRQSVEESVGSLVGYLEQKGYLKPS